MNIKRYIFAALASFIFIFGFDFLWHGNLLMDAYEQTSSLWRSAEEMQAHFPCMLITQLLTAGLISFLFTRNYEGQGIGEGLRFGLTIGLILGVLQAGSYAYMPITTYIAGMWMLGGILTGLGIGILCSLIYKD